MPRVYQIVFTGCFLTLIFAVPLTQVGIEIYEGQRPQVSELFLHLPTEANLRGFESEVEDSSWFAQFLRLWMQYLRFELLWDLGEKVLLGRDGWLFYRPDVQYLVEPYRLSETHHAAGDDPFSAITTFRDQLSRRGIRLMIVPIPGKASIYPDKLTRRAAAPDRSISSHTLELISRLKKAGVEVIDLFEPFRRLREKQPMPSGQAYYLRQDTHWSGMTVSIAAGVVAQRIHNLGWVDRGSTQYDLKLVSVRRRSDIIRMVTVPGIERHFPAEEVRCYQVVHRASGKLYKDDPRSPVLVLGDSFLRIYQTDEPGSAGFIAHLARMLKHPLASIVNDGGASTLVRQELSRKVDVLRGKKLVIWEFVERDIRFGVQGWKYVPVFAD
ncbi:hypothetical protein MYX78_04295 [Acidobacteria bacterium AH-259-G07]|nr:hypothetical protein [Acidobacteria bacterium AH-259-G07]